MENDFLILADAVEAVNGKLYMLGGGWDQFTATQFPTGARLGIAIGFLTSSDDTGKNYPLQIMISDPDKRPIIQAQIEIRVGPARNSNLMQRAIIALNLTLSLPRPGIYTVLAMVDSDLKQEISFEAILVIPRQES